MSFGQAERRVEDLISEHYLVANAFCPSTDKSWTCLGWILASEREDFQAKQSQYFVGAEPRVRWQAETVGKQREEFLEALRIGVGQAKRRVPGGTKDWMGS
ncbi:unnamed protein product [Prunus armeniaca]|uniref:Uncharacterized protein n=1 Tax=Prunus armeniaca TaxID=36596 RepID=A0A6J5VCT5_PRUAR|nr:unnamed protein product [Prunus armeniaca]